MVMRLTLEDVLGEGWHTFFALLRTQLAVSQVTEKKCRPNAGCGNYLAGCTSYTEKACHRLCCSSASDKQTGAKTNATDERGAFTPSLHSQDNFVEPDNPPTRLCKRTCHIDWSRS